jgi:DNA-binding NarL/FixJ family response regulator
MATTTERDAHGDTVDQVRARIEAALGNRRNDPPFGTIRRRLDSPVELRRRRDDTHLQPRHRSVSVMLADDRTAIRAGMSRALEHHGFDVVATAIDAESALAAAQRYEPKLCLLEIDLPGGSAEAIAAIRRALPGTRIAVLTASRDGQDVVDALRAGADGYLMKTIAPDRLSVALAALMRGEIVLPRSLTAALVSELRRPEAVVHRQPPHGDQWQSRLLYVPRFVRHFSRRWRAGMSTAEAWSSTRARMRRYNEPGARDS